MFRYALPMILAVSSGISLVIQQSLNSNLRVELKSAAWSGVISYFVGLVCMVVLTLILQEPTPASAVATRLPWWSWSGGLFGAVYIALGILLVPQLGSATFFALLIAGQMIGSLVFDHFGVLGLPVHSISPIRLAGAGLVFLGAVLVRMYD